MDSPTTSHPHPQVINNDGSSSSSFPVITTTQATHQVIPSGPNHETLDPKAGNSETLDPKIGQSSEIFCGLCDARKETDQNHQMFTVESCKHSFCADCIIKHVDSKIKVGRHIIPCPGLDCKAVIELEACTPILPKSMVEKWNDSLFEALMTEEQCKMCPKCTFYVEKTRGCLRITCRSCRDSYSLVFALNKCDFQFCDRCGKEWTDGEHRISCQKDEEEDEEED